MIAPSYAGCVHTYVSVIAVTLLGTVSFLPFGRAQHHHLRVRIGDGQVSHFIRLAFLLRLRELMALRNGMVERVA